jgi:hypothetical protein
LFSIKGVLILFDIGTGLVLIRLLTRLNLPKIWSVAWFWCPLLLKEISNSGHLDSIAVFFTTLAVWMLVSSLWPKRIDAKPSLILTALAFVVLAVAVAAKIYPLVLFPVFVVVALKRLGVPALLPTVLFPLLVAVLLWPILSHLDSVKNLQQQITGVPPQASASPPPGIEAFARHWEMNDFLFMVIVENLKPYGNKPEDFDVRAGDQPSRIWFVKTSNQFRHNTAEAIADVVPTVDKRAAAFWLTRMVTLGVFGVCRNPAWYLFAVTSLAYYLRFYCEYHLTGQPDDPGKFGTPFSGTALFDFNVPILEFAPLLVLLVLFMLVRVAMGSARSGNDVSA